MNHPALPLILASSSPYRRELLTRLRLPFSHASPDIDETPRPGETASQLVQRLARAKAQALASSHPAALIIGSDQAATLEGTPIGKPGNLERAFAQLKAASGKTISFHTGLCLLDTSTGQEQVAEDIYEVSFRPLEDAEIKRYLLAEQPWDCAGSFKAEGLGIALFTGFAGKDPNSLIGLPLMTLCDMLRAAGVAVP
jgi:MAF protein